MISVTDLRNGATITIGKDIFQVLSYEHIKLGRGTANIKIKVKNARTGTTTEKSFISGAKVAEAPLEKREAQYLYKIQNQKAKAQNFVFMDAKSFEQFELSEEKISDVVPFLKEGMTVKMLFYNEEPLTLELPIKIEFTVAQTNPGVRGDSAVNIYKDATLENGLKIKVPLFIDSGDKVLVDTRTGEYLNKCKN